MVKSKPKLSDRQSRKRHRFQQQQKSHHLHLLKLASFSPSPSQKPKETHPNSPKTTPETMTKTTEKSQKSPVTPSSLSSRTLRRRIKFKKQSRSSSSYSSKSLSLSLSPSVSCSSSSSPRISLSPLNFTPSPAGKTTVTPEVLPFPPLPPKPSPEFLRRSISDPSALLPHLSGDNSFTPMKSPSRPVSRNLMGQLTPLPTSSPSSFLRRTISDPVPLQCSSSKEENDKGKMKHQTVEAEKLSGEWIVLKVNCECGKDGHYLVNANDKKYFKLV